jgi:hypothetical protein
MTDVTEELRTASGYEPADQPDTGAATGPSRRRARGRDRHHLTPGRPRQVKIRYTDDEYGDVAAAAAAAGLTPTGYAGEAALAAARDAASPSTAPWRRALLELMAARGQVRRFGSNVNQAVRTLNALGETPEWLASAVAITERAVTRLAEAAATVAVVARADRTRSARPRATGPDTGHGRAPGARRPAYPGAGQPTKNGGQAVAVSHDTRLADSSHSTPADRAVGDGAP